MPNANEIKEYVRTNIDFLVKSRSSQITQELLTSLKEIYVTSDAYRHKVTSLKKEECREAEQSLDRLHAFLTAYLASRHLTCRTPVNNTSIISTNAPEEQKKAISPQELNNANALNQQKNINLSSKITNQQDCSAKPQATLPGKHLYSAIKGIYASPARKWVSRALAVAAIIGIGLRTSNSGTLETKILSSYKNATETVSGILYQGEYLYFVAPGDTLEKIAVEVTGDAANKLGIWQINQLQSSELAVNQVLQIPSKYAKHKQNLTKAQMADLRTKPAADKLPYRPYHVGNSDTLESISEQLFRTRQYANLLYDFNRMYNYRFQRALIEGQEILMPPMAPIRFKDTNYANFKPTLWLKVNPSTTLRYVSVYLSGSDDYVNDLVLYNKLHNPSFRQDLKGVERVYFPPLVPKWTKLNG
jgi:hypothetical protein